MIIKIKSDITGKEYSGNNMEELVAQCEADDKAYNKTLETKKKENELSSIKKELSKEVKKAEDSLTEAYAQYNKLKEEVKADLEKSKRGEDFIGCSAFPKCHYVEGLAKKEPVHYEKEGQVCPKCGKGHLVAKSSRYGTFYACSNYPECKYTEKIFVKKAKKNEN